MSVPESRIGLIDDMISCRITNICNKECLSDFYLEIQNKIIEIRKLLANDLQNDKLQLLNSYDKLNNDISELIYKALYIEGYKDGLVINPAPNSSISDD